MLRRAARRRDLHHLRLSAGQLTLPWLCPAFSKPHSHSAVQGLTYSSPSSNHSTTSIPTRPPFQSKRALATATDLAIPDNEYDIPFEDLQGSLVQGYNPLRTYLPPLPQFGQGHLDPASSIVILDDLPQTKQRILRKINGIGGDASEMLANFDVSLKVGKFERAATLLQRLSQFYSRGSQEYLELHNKYLQAMVTHMVTLRLTDLTRPLQRWFEVKLPQAGVQPDATTFASMLRMALRMLHGSKRDRTVRRYWEMVKAADLEEEVLSLTVLTDTEIGQLSEICPADLRRVSMNGVEELASQQSLETHQVTESIPVRAVDQKGYGLKSLQESLALFSENPGLLPSDPEALKQFHELRQQKLEMDAIESAMSRWRREMEAMRDSGIDTSASGRKLGFLVNQWHNELVAKIKEELKLVDEAEEENSARSIPHRERREYGVYLRSMDPEKLAALTILHVVQIFTRAGVEKGLKVSSVVTTLGREVQDELIAEEILRKNNHDNSHRRKMVAQMLEKRKKKAGRPQWRTLVTQVKESSPTVFWPPRVTAKVGGILVSLLFDVAKTPVSIQDPNTKKQVTSFQPAFHHSYEVQKGRRTGLIHIHPEVSGRLFREPPTDLIARHLPMVTEPKPWTGLREGGYLAHQSAIMRCTPGDSYQELYAKAALNNNGLEHVRAGLDVLGKTPWVINQDVYEIMLEAWNSGEEIANIPPEDPDLPVPPKPTNEDDQELKAWNRKVLEIENKRSGLHSNRCFQNFQMEIARSFRNETFYLPHNMDFRGRAYPLPPYLNQMGADNARGLLLFKDAKPLGAEGLRWLKIHLSNVYGFDKASLQEREDFTMEHLDDVLDSANNGLRGRRWFLEAEDPWQCLAACCELRNALRLSDPTQYASRLPIHQDGSCNGLQHYAALGGDVEGAQQVNLEPSDRPSDVYTGVAEFVKEKVAKDAAAGDEIAKLLVGKIKRKIVKQTVMTNVYGVTFIGAMRQVRRQLVDHYPDLPQMSECAKYVARSIFNALGSIFSGAHSIQYWLGDCASRITTSLSPEQIGEIAKNVSNPSQSSAAVAKKENDPTKKFKSTVIWTTPLGLPVVQPYRKTTTRRVQTSLQDLSIQDASHENPVSKRKQLQAFPPNFIHSLDATHMMLSAIECSRRGLTFSAVHDSFWTHASDIDTMNSVLRDCFIRMHSDDIIKRLASEFRERYGRHIFLAKVSATSKIGQTIDQYRRKNKTSSGTLNELLDEQKRQSLLHSEDPDQQAQGRAMVTAASIFEELGGADSDLAVSATLGETAVGQVPEDIESLQRVASAGKIDSKDPALSSLFSEVDPQFGEHANDAAVTERNGLLEEEEEEEEATAPPKKSAKVNKLTWLWLPLNFREVPSKGDFDVNRLKESKYFFS